MNELSQKKPMVAAMRQNNSVQESYQYMPRRICRLQNGHTQRGKRMSVHRHKSTQKQQENMHMQARRVKQRDTASLDRYSRPEVSISRIYQTKSKPILTVLG